MQNKDKPDNHSLKISNRYRINLILFAFLAIALMFWFHKHLYAYMAGSTFIGGTLTLWAGWKIIQSWAKWGLNQSEIPIAQRLLNRASSTETLVLSLIVVIALFLGTSSVYVVYEGAKSGENQFEIEVTNQDNLYFEPLQVTSFNRLAGRPMFLRAKSLDLEFSIKNPWGYAPVTKKFNPWTNIHLRVPADFEYKQFNAIYLVPGLTLRDILPKIDEYPQTSYQMFIRWKNRNFTIKDLRFQTVFAGASGEDLRRLFAKMDKNGFHKTLNDYLMEISEMPDDVRNRFIHRWTTKPHLLETPEFQVGDSIEIEISRDDSSTPLILESIIITPQQMNTPIFLEVKNE